MITQRHNPAYRLACFLLPNEFDMQKIPGRIYIPPGIFIVEGSILAIFFFAVLTAVDLVLWISQYEYMI